MSRSQTRLWGGRPKRAGAMIDRQSQKQRAEDDPAGADLDVAVVVVGAEDAQQVEPTDERQGDPAGQDDLGVEPGVLRARRTPARPC